MASGAHATIKLLAEPMLIHTKRLTLRHLTEQDLAATQQLLSCPEVMAYSINGPYTLDKTKAFLQHCLDRSSANQPTLLAVIEKSSQTLIGYSGFYPQTIQGRAETELGYRLLKTHWGKGLATEATQALIDYAFNQLALPRLISIITPQNHASVRVAQKNGFKVEQRLRYDKKLIVDIYAQQNHTL